MITVWKFGNHPVREFMQKNVHYSLYFSALCRTDVGVHHTKLVQNLHSIRKLRNTYIICRNEKGVGTKHPHINYYVFRMVSCWQDSGFDDVAKAQHGSDWAVLHFHTSTNTNTQPQDCTFGWLSIHCLPVGSDRSLVSCKQVADSLDHIIIDWSCDIFHGNDWAVDWTCWASLPATSNSISSVTLLVMLESRSSWLVSSSVLSSVGIPLMDKSLSPICRTPHLCMVNHKRIN